MENAGATVRETVNATTTRFGEGDLDELFQGGKKVTVAKGKKVLTFDLGDSDLDEAAFQKAVLGPSGNLRAPTARVGKNWYVGFNEEAYADLGP